MNILYFFKSCYHYTFGCCCGRRQPDALNEQTRLIVEEGCDGQVNQAFLNEQVPVGRTGSKSVEGTGQKVLVKPAKSTELVAQAEAEDSLKTDVKEFPVQVHEPEHVPRIDIYDSTRRIVANDVQESLIQEEFFLSKIVYIDRGSFGMVYKSHDPTNPDAKFAVKVVNKENENWYQRAQNELQLLAKVKHGNIVTLYDYFWIKKAINLDPFCLVLKSELLDSNLEKVFKQLSEPLPTPVIKRMALQLGGALSYLHRTCQVAHHDFKAQNCMVTPFKSIYEPEEILVEYLSEGGFKIIDLGFGREYSCVDLQSCKECYYREGTRKYKSLEKLLSESYIPFSADCFAFGILLLEVLMGFDEFESEYTKVKNTIWHPKTDQVLKTPYNFVLKIAQRFFNKLPEMEPIHRLVLNLLADEPERWFMDQALEDINNL